MNTEISSKSELLSLATSLKRCADNIKEQAEGIKTSSSGLSDVDGINVSGAGSTLGSSMIAAAEDFDTIADNILSYAAQINGYDINDLVESDGTLYDEIANGSKVVMKDNAPVDSNSNNTSAGTQVYNLSTNSGYVPDKNSGPGSSSSGSSSYAGLASAGVSYAWSTGSNNSSSSSGTSTGAVSGSTTWSTGGSTPSSSLNTGDSTEEIKEKTIYKTAGKTSSDGRTQRSAKQDIVIAPVDPEAEPVDISKYKNREEYGFKVTTDNLTYELCEEDIDLLCAIVSAESDKSYDDALAVITTILNRCETSNWIRSHGRDPIAQATAPNQFVVYQHGSYEGYMNGNAPETVKTAVMDALAGVRNHKYCSFRSNGTTSYSNNQISPTGNRYK